MNLGRLFQSSPTEELADFLFPWLLLGSKHGLAVNADVWDKLAEHYRAREPKTEFTHLRSLNSMISALQSSAGRWEQQYKSKIDQFEQERKWTS